MLAKLLYPLYLPVLHLVTLATVPVTFLYAAAGLLLSPIIIPLLIAKTAVMLGLSAPLLLAATPIAAPVGFFLAAACITKQAICSFIFVLTPLLWPVYFLCKWFHYTCMVAQVGQFGGQ